MIKTTLKNTLLKMEHFLGVIECESITKNITYFSLTLN
jgi:hypothetical protein